MKKHLLILLVGMFTNIIARSAELISPNGLIKVEIHVTDKISYDIYKGNRLLLKNCSLGINIDKAYLDREIKVRSLKSFKINEQLNPVVPLKFSKIDNLCNVLVMKLSSGYSVEFRAYDGGVAYRFITDLKGDKNGQIKVISENITLPLPNSYQLHVQPAKDFTSNYETNYIILMLRHGQILNRWLLYQP